MGKINLLVQKILWSPLLWGGLAALAFYGAVHSGHLTNPFVLRYFSGHWVEYVTTVLFFVGLAAIGLKALNVGMQIQSLDTPLLDAIPKGGQPVAHCSYLLDRLARQPANLQGGYLVQRLRDAIEHVHRKGSAETLNDELHFLADSDGAKMSSSFAMIRIIIWAVPILGFLGTVIGITNAVASLSPEALEESLPGVTAGLGVAFDTTSLSLSLSMVLMFAMFFAERYESRLLAGVDARVNREMVGRFEEIAASSDPQVATLRRVADAVLQATEKLVERQAQLWQHSIEAAWQQWNEMAVTTGKQLESALAGALDKNVQLHASTLAAAEQAASQQNQRHWQQVQQALLQNAEAVTLQQHELVKQGDVLLQVVEATGQVTKLENVLNHNLEALAGAKHFEETVTSLAAAVNLLTARASSSFEAARVELKSPRKGQAA